MDEEKAAFSRDALLDSLREHSLFGQGSLGMQGYTADALTVLISAQGLARQKGEEVADAAHVAHVLFMDNLVGHRVGFICQADMAMLFQELRAMVSWPQERREKAQVSDLLHFASLVGAQRPIPERGGLIVDVNDLILGLLDEDAKPLGDVFERCGMTRTAVEKAMPRALKARELHQKQSKSLDPNAGLQGPTPPPDPSLERRGGSRMGFQTTAVQPTSTLKPAPEGGAGPVHPGGGLLAGPAASPPVVPITPPPMNWDSDMDSESQSIGGVGAEETERRPWGYGGSAGPGAAGDKNVNIAGEKSTSAAEPEAGGGKSTVDQGRSAGFSVAKAVKSAQAAAAPPPAKAPSSSPAPAPVPPRPARPARKPNSLLALCGVDLVEVAASGRLDPCVGRDAEIDRCLFVLSRKTKNNPVLLGEPGVGKTAIVEGVALRILEGRVPPSLQEVRELWSVSVGSMIAGTKLRGEFEERMQGLLKEVEERQGEIILFIDELHMLVGAGRSEGGNIDAANLLKPKLARGELRCVGATTPEEYRTHIAGKDAAFERRWQPLKVPEPSEELAIEMLKALLPGYEEHHGISVADGVLEVAVRLSNRQVKGRFLPDKAVDVLDEACAAAAAAGDAEVTEAHAIAVVEGFKSGQALASGTGESKSNSDSSPEVFSLEETKVEGEERPNSGNDTKNSEDETLGEAATRFVRVLQRKASRLFQLRSRL